MTFALPWVSYLAAATPVALALVFALDFTRRRSALDRIVDPRMHARMLASLSVRRRVVKGILLVIGLTGVVVALARPQVEGKSSWRQRGIDVAVVVDFSKSMLAEDVYPSRFRRSLVELDLIVEELEANRIAVIASAGTAEYFPLTHDADAIRGFLRGVRPDDITAGSDLGAGIALARCVLVPERSDNDECASIGRRAGGGAPLGVDEALSKPAVAAAPTDDRARAMVIFTDGGDTGGRFADEIALASQLGVRIFIVGVGTAAGELIPKTDASGRRVGWIRDGKGAYVTTRLERDLLEQAVAAGGDSAQLFALNGRGFARADLIAELQTLKKGNLDERVVRRPVEVYHWFLFPAFLLLILEACIRERRRTK